MEAVTRAAALTAQSRRWRVLSLCLITLVSMAISDLPAQDLSLLDSNTAKQSLTEVPQNTASPIPLLYTSYQALGQFSDIHRTFSILPNTESPKPSEYYYSHTVNTVYGSASMPPPSSVPKPPEPLSGPVILSGVQLSQTSSNFPSAGLDSFLEPPFPSSELQAERISNSTSTSGKHKELSNQLVLSHDFNIQNDAALDDQLYPSHTMFGTFHVTSSFTEPTMGPPEVYYPTNTMDVDYGSGSGDYLETMSYLGSEGDDYSLVTNFPSDMYDFEDSNSESYDTSFPTRAMIPLYTRYLSPSSLTTFPSRHITMNSSTAFSVTSNSTSTLQVPNSEMTNVMISRFSTLPSISNSPTHISSTIYLGVEAIHPTAVHSSISLHQSDIVSDTSEIYTNWPDVTIEPSDVLLPDMNSLEYYNIQLTKNNESLTEQRGNQTTSKHFSLPVSISTTSTYTVPASHMFTVMYGEDLQNMDPSWPEESSTDLSGLNLSNTTVLDLSDIRPSLMNATFPFLYSSALTPSMDFSNSLWDLAATTDWISTESISSSISFTSVLFPHTDPVESDVMFLNSTNTHWSINSTVPETSHPTSSLIDNVFTQTHNVSEVPTESSLNITSVLSVTEMADQGFTGAGSSFNPVTDDEMTTVSKPADFTPSVLNNETTMSAPGATTEVFNATTLLTTPSVTTLQTSTLLTTTIREYLCNLTKPDTYLVRVGFPFGSTAGYAKAKVREILKAEFNRSVELQVVKSPPDFVFRAVSGPVVYTAISVMNALRRFAFTSDTILSVSPISPVPGLQYHIHSVLQFVPIHVDMHVCTFIEHIERGLIYAFAEVRRRFKESTDFSVNILNITMSSVAPAQRQLRGPLDITFVVRDARGYILGSEVSSHLRHLSVVEFSYYLGYPVQQIAEPYHYPELNTTQLLRSSWVKTVLLGVMEHDVSDRIFQAKMERRLALLLGEGLSAGRRLKRATSVGNNSVQIVQITRLEEQDNPLEMIYFVEGVNSERLPAVTTANLLNRLDVQHAAILLGYRIQGILAQPVEKQALPSETENTNTWIIVGVVVPVLVVMIIISILYWKLCRTDKLEFQPDTMSTVQQRQKLQTPSVKGFDFAKLHLGQHSKDDLRVIQEPLPAPAPAKEPNANENTGASTPKNSKGSSTKASCNSQHRKSQISPSDGDSLGSEPFSERESPKANPRQAGLSSDPKQPRRNKIGPPTLNVADEQVSSASIFEHVDRMSRSADGANKRFSSKIQLIAMQPMPALPLPCPAVDTKAADNSKINKEIQVALRQKSEIEHHRNKIRLRAKRKGHYDFPAMDNLMDSLGDAKEQDRIYQKAQMQIDKILDPDSRVPPLYTEPRKREKRSPKQRKKQQINGDLTDADRDRLLTNDSDGTYKKYPGVNNVAYVSDPDQGPEAQSPSPSDDVFLSSMSPPAGLVAPPPPYLPPQPSIEEARQQMHSLLDDAFALVSPTSQAANAGITLPGLGVRNEPTALSSPPSRGPRPCGPSYPALSPFSGRYSDLGLSPSTVQGLTHRQGLGGGYNQGEGVSGEQLQSEGLYNSRGGYIDELPSSARPRPVGGTTGAQLHHMTQMGLSGRVNEARQLGALNWGHYHEEDFRPVNRDPVLNSFDYPLVSMFQTPRSGMREPSAPPAHLDTMGLGFSPSAPPEDSIPPSHSSASLIKAIREELMRLSQKQAAPAGYHS
ncbi:UPF0606 protein KIAA1549 isoform X1 [Silurus meridionalis]|uniref:UPF0606 protein KIAA1549 isoform X1 n=1 Tax=Silurus meridionalis TaxID=175797 RepID=UPI001EE9DCC0|nr:UPF0606 protein KIAA1549 isoform X1 [Silurus meridionalis]XP_046720414.1 UPF0606 protein KIAA1549 isoform X1 [Silurus meridionalis]XP_046720415.1 UPF0606 protein KIAA1549 isoform X1 [Silurus meridionalis]